MMVSAEQDPRRAGTIWALTLDHLPPEVMPLVPATFDQLDAQAAPELVEAVGGDVLAEVRRRLRLGRRCYAARVDGRLAAYGWVSFGEELIGELDLRVRLRPDEAYIWNCATLPAFRRRHLYSALLVYIARELGKAGAKRLWIGADLENVSSQRGIARAGFTHVADLLIARVLALRQVWVQGCPGVPDDLVEQARRAFLNDRHKIWLRVVDALPRQQPD